VSTEQPAAIGVRIGILVCVHLMLAAVAIAVAGWWKLLVFLSGYLASFAAMPSALRRKSAVVGAPPKLCLAGAFLLIGAVALAVKCVVNTGLDFESASGWSTLYGVGYLILAGLDMFATAVWHAFDRMASMGAQAWSRVSDEKVPR